MSFGGVRIHNGEKPQKDPPLGLRLACLEKAIPLSMSFRRPFDVHYSTIRFFSAQSFPPHGTNSPRSNRSRRRSLFSASIFLSDALLLLYAAKAPGR